jgi:predicted DNA-binding WGR domain protein
MMEKLFSKYIEGIKMDKKRVNWVGHCFSRSKNHDKLYIIAIHETDDNKYEVYAHWGRAGSNLRTQKKSIHHSYDAAAVVAYDLFVKKAVKGYCDLSANNSNYTGSLSLTHEWVAPYLAEEPENFLGDGEFVVICKNNSFVQTKFDVGVEYVACRNDNPTLFNVEDRFGDVQTVARDKFDVVPA